MQGRILNTKYWKWLYLSDTENYLRSKVTLVMTGTRAQHFLGDFWVIWNNKWFFVSHQNSFNGICTAHFDRAIDNLCSLLANLNSTHLLSQPLYNEILITDDLRLSIIIDYYNFIRCLMDLSQIKVICTNKDLSEEIRIEIYKQQADNH